MFKYEHLTKNTERAKKYFEDKLAFTVGPVELKTIMNDENIKIIDVRKSEHYNKAHIPGAHSIPGEDLESKLSGLSSEHLHILYCYTEQCHLAAKCALKLAKNGFPAIELEGGFDAWENIYDFEVEKHKKSA
ncbi:MAG: rhodanese-like domain-containing protein [Candidatus Gastranaerophilales bacterium]|nr:rhodanese-like domain-containing protein [Candidatus Gastranaerophilales bacterium]